MRHSSIRAVYAYWNALRGKRPAPLRTEVEPRALARELGDLFLLEGDEREMRFRLAGSRIVHALGDSLTGKAFSMLWDEQAKNNGAEALAKVAGAEEPMLLGIRIPEPDEPARPSPTSTPRRSSWLNLRPMPGPRIERRASTLAGEMLLLPLSHPPRAGLRMLGAFALFEPPTLPRETPARLSISGERMLGRDAVPVRGSDLRPGALAEKVGMRRGHLLLLQGDRDPPILPPRSKA
jgi:hypothetical protein